MIVANNECFTAPFADAMYAPDARWWNVYGDRARAQFQGERWTCAPDIPGTNWVQAADNEPGLSANPNRIHTGGNSGYSLVGLAALWLWNAGRIVLTGYDMQKTGGHAHHYGNHEGDLPNADGDMGAWRERFIALAVDLRERGIEVTNATRATALTCFERCSIGDALG